MARLVKFIVFFIMSLSHRQQENLLNALITELSFWCHGDVETEDPAILYIIYTVTRPIAT